MILEAFAEAMIEPATLEPTRIGVIACAEATGGPTECPPDLNNVRGEMEPTKDGRLCIVGELYNDEYTYTYAKCDDGFDSLFNGETSEPVGGMQHP